MNGLDISLAAIAGAAFVDSINPCAIAVLVILLTTLLLQNKKKRALIGGLCFTLSIFISYFMFGIGIIYTIEVSGLSLLIYRFVGILAVLIGIANLKDAIWYGKGGFVMEIPMSWRPYMKKLIGGVTSPIGAFLIGFLVMLFELPCTGGPYFFVIGLLAKDVNWSIIIPILIFYNLIFILPLVVLTFLIYAGHCTVEKASEWKDKNIKTLHLIAGIVMISIGIWVLMN